MNSIDRRIVDMRFDNRDFQRNALQTVKTLDDLKAALNFGGVKDGFGQLEKSAGRFSLRNIVDNVKNAVTNFPILGAIGFSAINRLTNAAMDFGSKFFQNIVEPITQGGWRRAMNLEQAQFQLEGLKISWEEIQPAILGAVKGTAYGLDEAAKAASQLAASQVPMENMEYSLRAISGVAAMTSSEYSDIANVFTKVAGQGRVMADDLNRLSARGLNAAATLADSLNMTEREVRDLVSEGGVSFEMFASAMDEAFGAHATKANETYTGSLSNMRAALARIGAVSAANKLTRYRDLFNSLTPAIDSVAEAVEPMQQAINDIKTEQFNNLINLINSIDFSDLISAGPHFAGAIRNIYEAVKGYLTPVFDALGRVFGGGASFSITNFARNIEDFTAKLIPAAGSLDKVTSGFEILFGVLKAIGQVGSTIVVGLLSVIGDVLAVFIPTASGFDAVTTSSTNFAEAIAKVSNNLREFLRGSFGRAGEILQNIAEVIGTALGNVFSWLGDNISIGDFFKSLLGAGVFGLIVRFTGLVNTVKGAIEQVKEALTSASENSGMFTELLSEVQDAISSFVMGIQIGSLALISASIFALSIALKNLSEIDVNKLLPALGAMAGLFAMLSLSLLSFRHILAGFGGGGLISAGISLVLLAAALNILSNALIKISDLNFDEIGRGLTGIFGTLTALSLFLRTTSMAKLGMGTAASLLILAFALTQIANAMDEMSDLSWEEIARGLVGMGGALAIFTVAVNILSKSSGFRSLAGSVAILIAAQTLGDIGEALEDLSDLTWGEIAKSLLTMSLAITVLTTVVKSLSKLKGVSALAGAVSLLIVAQTLKDIGDALEDISDIGWGDIAKSLLAMQIAMFALSGAVKRLSKMSAFKNLAASVSLLIAVQSLKDIATALEDIGSLDWDEIFKGLVGISGVLTALGVVTTLVGRSKSLKTLLASASLLIAVQTLTSIADALNELSGLEWSDILKGITGIAGVLAVMGTITTIMGKVGPIGSLIASAGLLIAAQTLEKIAQPLADVGALSWEEIAKGLVGITGALVIIGGLSAVLGTIAPVAAIIGAGSIWVVTQALGDLAETLGTFSNYSWDEIGRSLTAMGGALGVIAVGSLANTLSILGAMSLEKVTKPLRDLPDILDRWKTVKVPKDFVENLGIIADGVSEFFLTFGAGSLEKSAKPLGDLADSIVKWKNVKVPKDFIESMERLSAGVSEFFLNFGGISIATITKPLGDLATAVKAWEGVKVPKDLESQLTSLANGVKAWSWAFAGGLSIGASVQPITNLADAVRAWDGVKVPSNMEANLTSLANGVKAWSWAFLGGWSMGASTKPITDLAQSVKAWEGVKVPPAMQPALVSLANGVKAWSWAFLGGWSMGASTKPIKDLAGAVKAWEGVKVPPAMQNALVSLSNGVKAWTWAFMGGWSMGVSTKPIKDLADAVKAWEDVRVPANMEANLRSLSNGVKSWTWAFMGGWSMGASTKPLRDLAGAVNAWRDVKIPPNMEGALTSLSNGVKSWTWAFMGAWSMGAAIKPIKDLAGAVGAWKDVKLPDNMEKNLRSLSNGVKSWSWAFLGAWSMGAATQPIKDMADAVKRWNNVEVPNNMEGKLTSLANGIKAFSFSFLGAWVAGNSTQPIRDLAGAVKQWEGVSFNTSIQSQLESLASGIQAFSWIWNNTSGMSDAVQPLRGMASAMRSWGTVNLPSNLGSILTSVANGLKSFSDIGRLDTISSDIRGLSSSVITLRGTTTQIGKAINNMAQQVQRGVTQVRTAFGALRSVISMQSTSIGKGLSSLINNVQSQMNRFVRAVNNGRTRIGNAFRNIGRTVSSSMRGSASNVRNALTSMGKALSSGISNIRSNMSVHGWNIGIALTNGMRRGLYAGAASVRAAAYSVAVSAAKAARGALQIRSPSRVAAEIGKYFDLGMAKGMVDNVRDVNNASSFVGESSIKHLRDAINDIGKRVFDEMDLDPTITPTLDLSDIESRASDISRILQPALSGATSRSASIASASFGPSESNQPTQSITNVEFKQTNNSPKALPSSEIYRRTKNQLSTLRENLEKK